VSFITHGNGTVSIKMKVPYVYQNKDYSYLGIHVNPNPLVSPFPHPYLYFLAPVDYDISESQFVIKRNATDGTKFTIESKKYPGNYLGVAKWKNTVQPVQSRLVYTSEKKEFFCMSN
jgi:hypothetical protein